mgnify:CR=1 FL=1
MTKLNHKNIIKLYETIHTDKYVFLILELCETDLYNYINNNEINEEDTKFIIKQIIEAIKYIMDNNIVHRDLKPLNICLKKTEPYFIDFGFSKKIIENNKHISEKKINSIIGSYSFISNNVKNNIEPTRRDDIESLLYILLFMFVDKNKENNFVGFDIKLESINNMVIKLYKFNLESFKKI